MFRFLLSILRCPEGSELELVVFKEAYNEYRKEDEIIEGVLISKKTGMVFPIVDSIPRMLPDALQTNTDFYDKYKEKLREYGLGFNEEGIKKFVKLNKQVKSRFEFQWKTWGKTNKIYGHDEASYKKHLFDNLSAKKVNDDFFKGKIVLEGGCGHGLFAKIHSPLCKEYIGLDLGEGIEVARWRTKQLPNVHLVQGDILNLPFRKNAFDYVFSTGVIHHTPDTHLAFEKLAGAVKSGGDLMIWVYPKGGILWEYGNKCLRFFTTKLPPSVLFYASYAMVPVLYIVPTYANNHPSKNSWMACSQSLYDWMSPSYQSHHTPEELISWFEKNGFKDIELTKIKTGASGTKI